MFRYDALSKKPEVFRSFSGLDVSEFDSVYGELESRYHDFERRRLSRKERKNQVGGGRPFKLELEDRLLVLLVYYRLYVTSTLLGFLFDLDHSTVLRDIHILEPLVAECLPLPKKLHKLTRRLRTIEEVEEFFPGFKAFIDSTEQEIPRPKKDTKKRKSHYSGKKRRHTVKTQVTVNSRGLIAHKTNHARGRRHDLDLYRQRHPRLPKEVEQDFDRGYDGVKNYFPDLKCAVPFKRRVKEGGTGARRPQTLHPPRRSSTASSQRRGSWWSTRYRG